jgi:hypothetical protein
MALKVYFAYLKHVRNPTKDDVIKIKSKSRTQAEEIAEREAHKREWQFIGAPKEYTIERIMNRKQLMRFDLRWHKYLWQAHAYTSLGR